MLLYIISLERYLITMSEEIKNNELENEAIEENTKEKTVNDELDEFQKEVMGKLDNPLVVHKKGDASYEEDTSAYEMNQTHNEETKPTLERHRFKKDPSKKGSNLSVILLIIIIFAGIFAGLYFTGNLPLKKGDDAAQTTAETVEETTDIAEKYIGKIVIKGTYIFVDGKEVDGIEGLQNSIKYEDASTTAYEIIDEHADADFLNYDVLPLLSDMQFFGDDTVITHIEKTGLMASEETTQPQTTTSAPETTTTTAPATEAVTG